MPSRFGRAPDRGLLSDSPRTPFPPRSSGSGSTPRALEALTQEDAAERAELSLEFFSRIERGATLPSVPTLARLASVLNVSADELLGREKGFEVCLTVNAN
ncbi:MAG TPA: helix-turn-helix transcriptional regulator [Anaeromyxobacteraceae bacterium]